MGTTRKRKSGDSEARTSTAAEQEATTPNAPAAGPETGALVLAYDRSTGAILSIHDMDAGGDPRELTPEECQGVLAGLAEAALANYSSQEASPEAEMEAAALQHQQAGFEQGYYQGVAEYESALSGEAPVYSPEEEAAYNQGVADYHALASGQTQGY